MITLALFPAIVTAVGFTVPEFILAPTATTIYLDAASVPKGTFRNEYDD
jgi:hypothetical protein